MIKIPYIPKISKSKGNGIVGGKLVLHAIPCGVFFGPRLGKGRRPMEYNDQNKTFSTQRLMHI